MRPSTLYTFYEKTTGKVMFISEVETPELAEGILQTLGGDCGFIEGEYPASEYKFEGGQPKLKSEVELQELKNTLAWAGLRTKRDELLQQSDWTQVPDAPVDKVAWAAYRQELRDLPSNTTDPSNPNWPLPPGS